MYFISPVVLKSYVREGREREEREGGRKGGRERERGGERGREGGRKRERDLDIKEVDSNNTHTWVLQTSLGS